MDPDAGDVGEVEGWIEEVTVPTRGPPVVGSCTSGGAGSSSAGPSHGEDAAMEAEEEASGAGAAEDEEEVVYQGRTGTVALSDFPHARESIPALGTRRQPLVG